MDGFERRKQKKIEQIYTAVWQLVQKHGAAKASVQEIAEWARVSPATIYNYFGTKEQIYSDMLEAWVDKQLSIYEEILGLEQSYPDKIKAIIVMEAKNIKAMPDEIDLPLRSREKLQSFFMKLVSMGKQEGAIRGDYSEALIERYFFMYMNEINRCGAEEIDDLLDLFFYGLM